MYLGPWWTIIELPVTYQNNLSFWSQPKSGMLCPLLQDKKVCNIEENKCITKFGGSFILKIAVAIDLGIESYILNKKQLKERWRKKKETIWLYPNIKLVHPKKTNNQHSTTLLAVIYLVINIVFMIVSNEWEEIHRTYKEQVFFIPIPLKHILGFLDYVQREMDPHCTIWWSLSHKTTKCCYVSSLAVSSC